MALLKDHGLLPPTATRCSHVTRPIERNVRSLQVEVSVPAVLSPPTRPQLGLPVIEDELRLGLAVDLDHGDKLPFAMR
jgi:hypothetical protein